MEEVDESGAGPTIGIATCSAIQPPPTCPLLNDYFRWHPDGNCKYAIQNGQVTVLLTA